MKQLIVLLASVMLGLFIFELVGGPLSGTVGTVWQSQVESRTMLEAGP